jgi:hypothetical protein
MFRFFAAAHGAEVDFDRIPATVLLTDVVASTESAARSWRWMWPGPVFRNGP